VDVERLERARIPDLDRDALRVRLLRHLQRLVHEPTGRDDRHVRALAVHTALADRDRLQLLRHLLLEPVERAVLEADDRVVVVEPLQAPATAISEIGVLRIRSGPNSSSMPAVTPIEPPISAMSSPITNTPSSCRIACDNASRTASR